MSGHQLLAGERFADMRRAHAYLCANAEFRAWQSRLRITSLVTACGFCLFVIFGVH